VIVDVMDKNFVTVTGPKTVSGVRRRRTNIAHIEPLQETVDIRRGASDEEVEKALQASKRLEDMKQPVKPSL